MTPSWKGLLMSRSSRSPKTPNYRPSTIIKAGGGVLLALLLPLGTGTVTTLALSANSKSVVTKAPVDIPGLLEKLPPPVIPLPPRATDHLFEVLVPSKAVPRTTFVIPPTSTTPPTTTPPKTTPPSTTPPTTTPPTTTPPTTTPPTTTPPTTTTPYVEQSSQNLELNPGTAETGYLSVGVMGPGKVNSFSFGIVGNVGAIGNVSVVITGCSSSPWTTLAQAEAASCSNPVSTAAATLTQLTSGAVVEPATGVSEQQPEVFRVTFSMPSSAGNSEENQNQSFQEVVGLFQ